MPAVMDVLSPLASEIIDASDYGALVVKGGTPAKARKLLEGVTLAQLFKVPIQSYGHAYAVVAALWLWHDGLHECHEIAQADTAKLEFAARNPHGKGWNPGQNVGSMQPVESDKAWIGRELAAAVNPLNFWHAIMHRREGDFSNAKYWYPRCRTHPAMRTIAVGAGTILGTDPATRSTQSGVGLGSNEFAFPNGFDPSAFVDMVEQAHTRPADDPAHAAAVAVQRVEWRTLFADCAFAAAGAGSMLGGGIES